MDNSTARKKVKHGGSTKKTCGGCGQSLPVAKIKCSCGRVARRRKAVEKKDHLTAMSCSEIKKKLERRANQLWATHDFSVVVLYHSRNPRRQHCSTFATAGLGQKFLEETNGVVESLFKKFLMSNIDVLNGEEAPHQATNQGGEEGDIGDSPGQSHENSVAVAHPGEELPHHATNQSGEEEDLHDTPGPGREESVTVAHL